MLATYSFLAIIYIWYNLWIYIYIYIRTITYRIKYHLIWCWFVDWVCHFFPNDLISYRESSLANPPLIAPDRWPSVRHSRCSTDCPRLSHSLSNPYWCDALFGYIDGGTADLFIYIDVMYAQLDSLEQSLAFYGFVRFAD